MAFDRRTVRSAARQQAAGRSRLVSVPAPFGGWNTRDAPAAMEPTDAVVLDNLFPDRGKLILRGGYEDYVTSSIGSDNVETLVTLTHGSTESFLCGTNDAIYNITTPGSPSDITGGATITVDRWQTTVFADSSAPTSPTVLAVNGTDNPWQWAGTGNIATWAPTGTGLTDNDLIWVHSFKNRVFAGEADSRDFWYGALGSIPGAMTRFPLSGIRGGQGNLLFMATWTRDAGDGPDDYAVFVTTEGQAIVYAGTDPGSASAWQIVGVYNIPRPLSIRGWANVLGDVVILTESDYISLSEAVRLGRINLQATKLSGAIQDASALYRSNYGWELIVWPDGRKLIANIPKNTNSEYEQHVVNVETAAPCRFTGWNMRTLGIFDGKLYGGGSGAVYRLDSTLSDDSDGTASAIEVRAAPAWLDFRSPGNKQVTAIRPILRASDGFSMATMVRTDFSDDEPVAVSSTGSSATSPEWDVPDWDTVFWATQPTVRGSSQWRVAHGIGTHFSPYLSLNAKNQVLEWLQTDYLVSPAAGL